MKIPIRSPHFYYEIDTDNLKGELFKSEPLPADNYIFDRKIGKARRSYNSFRHKGIYNDLRVAKKNGKDLSLEEKAELL